MKAKCIIMTVLFFLVANVYAQRGTGKIESLRGLKGVYVFVEYLYPDIEKDGLRKDSIQTDVVLKLQLAGIKVLTRKEFVKEPGRPYLYINVNSVKNESFSYVYYIEVDLIQKVFLARDPKTRTFGTTTWRKVGMGIVGEQKADDIRDNIKDLVDKFINDYLSVNNPKDLAPKS